VEIPAELRERNQWVSWRYETRGGRLTKVPVSPVTCRRASSTDPSTWGSYRQALGMVTAEGIGFVFSKDDPYCGVDLDRCVARSGSLHPKAYKIVHAMASYVEFSPSGTGLHIIVRGRLGKGRRTTKTPWRGDLEIYDRGRFFTMGDEGRGTIREAGDELSALISFYFPGPDETVPVRPSKPLSDDDTVIVDRMLDNPRLAALWAGDTAEHGGDTSAGDLALCNRLAAWTGNDGPRVDSLFRRSARMRDKWDESRGESTYGSQTIGRALRG
jgi:putative DNA primase/helicase